MKAEPRRTFLQSVLALPLLGVFLGGARVARTQALRGVPVGADQDRFGQRRNVFGSLPIDVKVSGLDVEDRLFIIEQIDDRKGGPPRHVHPRQEEWFYVVSGRYVIEIDDERHELNPGDSILAPRGIPHVWAHVGDGTGRMLIAFQPAGKMESFFSAATRLEGIPQGPALARLFHEHGMDVLGPPLRTE